MECYRGRQRRSHNIDGKAHDRLFFDLFASEHRDIEERPQPRRRQVRARLANC